MLKEYSLSSTELRTRDALPASPVKASSKVEALAQRELNLEEYNKVQTKSVEELPVTSGKDVEVGDLEIKSLIYRPLDAAKEKLQIQIERDFDEIYSLGLKCYTPKGLIAFLCTPMAVFGNKTGLELMESGDCKSVLAALAADFDGMGY
jgi:hypothetical protein